MGRAAMKLLSDLQDIIDHYDVGVLVDYRRDLRGTVNINYEIITEAGGMLRKFFLRCYKDSIQPEEIEFEHSLIQHLVSQGFSIVARVHPARSGKTYLEYKVENAQKPRYVALFDYIPGEDRYSWVNPRCTRQEIVSAAQTLAQYHSAIRGFVPRGYRSEPEIIDLLPEISQAILISRENPKGGRFDRYLQAHLEFLVEKIEQLTHTLENQLPRDLPKLVIHSDYHPGNLKFQNERVVGLLDFDWSKIDLRAFDVALAAWYFFTEWSPDRNGSLRLDELEVFLSEYQRHLMEMGSLSPMNSAELEFFPLFLQAANFYVLNWAVQDYYGENVHDDEYLLYLEHCVTSSLWLNATNLPDMKNMLPKM